MTLSILTPTSKTASRSERPLNTTATNDDIRQYRQAVAGVLEAPATETLATPDPDWRRGWPALAALGATSFCVPEDRGGAGMQVEAATTTAGELGAALHGSPYAGLVASAHALSAADPDDTATTELITAIVAGETICAFGRLTPGTTVARNVDGAAGAEALLLADPALGGFALLTDASAWSVEVGPDPFDVSRRAGDVTIDDATRGHRIGPCPTAHHLFGLLLAADALGGTERALDRTVAYARDREAFGRPIGGFQAVQHRLADHAVRVRGMALALQRAARALTADEPGAARAVAVAEASVSSGAGHILHDLVQLTGAIGFTWEYGLHFLERRAHQNARLAANPRRARHTLAELEGWTDGR